MILRRLSDQQILCQDIFVASTPLARLKGLIGTKELKNRGFYFPRCNWIFTFFMSIPIDVIYLDNQGCIKKLQPHLRPWLLPAPVFSARHVLEMPAGFIQDSNLKVGELLHVGH